MDGATEALRGCSMGDGEDMGTLEERLSPRGRRGDIPAESIVELLRGCGWAGDSGVSGEGAWVWLLAGSRFVML